MMNPDDEEIEQISLLDFERKLDKNVKDLKILDLRKKKEHCGF